MKKNTTKRALVASILALAMCFSMLVGTTLAWFTDSATSTGNVIETGTLKVDLEVLAEDNSAWNSIKTNKDPIFNYTNWEPGFVQLKLLRVENEGSLALKWKATLSSENGVSELADVIDVYVKAFGVRANDNLSDVVYPTDRADILDGYTKVGTLAQFIADIESTTNGTLLAGEKAYLGIAFKMQDTADDYYQAMTLGEFDIRIVAGQLAYEEDSWNDGYDADATYPTVSAPVTRPAATTEKVVIKTTGANGEIKNEVALPAELVNALPADVTEITFAQSEPTVGVGTLTFASIELLDQDGEIIDLTENDVSLTVTLNVATYFADGDLVDIYHDGELITRAIVANGTVTYNAKHFCEVELKAQAEATLEKNAEGVYEIGSVAQLLLFANTVNAGNRLQGQTVALTADIDLMNMPWTPIGNSTYSFNGTFDGQGHSISNLFVDGKGTSYQGLFGFTQNGAIKNLTVNNAIVEGRLSVGVVAGCPYTSTYSNITVTGHVEVIGFAYVGGVGGRNAYASWDNITVDVDADSYVKACSVENGTAYRTYVGGVIGFMGEGGHKVSNVTSNIDVIGSTIDVGGIVGIAHYGNVFENIVCTGDVTVTDAADAVDADEIGGIAGVWNNGGSPVTFEGCSFEGKLTANIADVDLSNNTITGKAYSKTGDGKLVIDGKVTAIVENMRELVAAVKAGVDVIDGMGANMGDFYYDVKFTDGLLVKNLKFTYMYGGGIDGTVTFENCEFVSDHSYSCHFDNGSGKVVFNNCLFDGWNSFGDAIDAVEFNDCTFDFTYNYGILRFYQDAVINNCVFTEAFDGIDTNETGTVVEFYGCTGIEGKIFNNGSAVGVWFVDGKDVSDSIISW